MTRTRCLVLIPAGPDTIADYLHDTIDSINYHLGQANCIVAVLDDSRRNSFSAIANRCPNATVLAATDYGDGRKSNTRGSLFAKQAGALRELRRRYVFDILLRMDTDALMIGNAPDQDALRFQHAHPEVGMIGAFHRRGDGTDKGAALAFKGRQLAREMRLRRAIHKFGLVTTLRRLVRDAEANGYTRGDMCTGGAFFLSPAAVSAMDDQGLLSLEVLGRSRLMDDLLMGLLCYAAGFTLADMPETDDVLAINWRGLPMPVEDLVSRNKKIVHSVKADDPIIEASIRDYFRKRRETATLS
jgi:hypothetical protein